MTRRVQIVAAPILVALVFMAALVVRVTDARDPPPVKRERKEPELLGSEASWLPDVG